ncbi:hypothetical protein Dsin_020865 [Dipteronia sinensis]|uniref:Uncharacterized protein n=1 Tax=Dipteronia sinensis TaxID=43782 RepID=A0AAE0E5D2_9ROSI|nr:hypothetical protein Dsin_020865 [Dipteronia sinensis]
MDPQSILILPSLGVELLASAMLLKLQNMDLLSYAFLSSRRFIGFSNDSCRLLGPHQFQTQCGKANRNKKLFALQQGHGLPMCSRHFIFKGYYCAEN